jgi:hypothetical protein
VGPQNFFEGGVWSVAGLANGGFVATRVHDEFAAFEFTMEFSVLSYDPSGSVVSDVSIYCVDNGGDKVTEAAGGGADTVIASASYALGAGVHVETLQTIDATATTAMALTGNELNNVIRGNAGINTIRGNGGADDMYAGVDSVRDTFAFAAATDSGLGAAMDQIYQFDKTSFAGDPNSDKISLSLIDADDDLAGNQAFRFVTFFTAPVATRPRARCGCRPWAPTPTS